ncbi:GNAT family N-acetyltransferase [Ruegeria marisrubri]|nr:GNAT family N-acyltransferase [Ruegeria marisrubri]
MAEAIFLDRGRYRVRTGRTGRDLEAARELRTLAFALNEPDQDEFDDICAHVLVEDKRAGGRLVCCFRMLLLESGSEVGRSYSARCYDLSALRAFPGPMVEMGRFCTRPDCTDPDILRAAWGAMAAYVDRNDVEMLFGCSSFPGTEVGRYQDAFALLKQRHLAPQRWRPRVKAPEIFCFDGRLRQFPDEKRAMLQMPPLLKTYLLMGGWISDHAVVDREMNTLHVFTGLEVRAIPASRKRLLRAVAG